MHMYTYTQTLTHTHTHNTHSMYKNNDYVHTHTHTHTHTHNALTHAKVHIHIQTLKRIHKLTCPRVTLYNSKLHFKADSNRLTCSNPRWLWQRWPHRWTYPHPPDSWLEVLGFGAAEDPRTEQAGGGLGTLPHSSPSSPVWQNPEFTAGKESATPSSFSPQSDRRPLARLQSRYIQDSVTTEREQN